MELEYIVKRELTDVPAARVLQGHSILTVPCVSLAMDSATSIMKPYDEFKKPAGEGYFRVSLWESGGAQSSAGEAEIVCGLNGECLKPKFVKREKIYRGSIACGLHALFVSDGLVTIKASHYRKDFSIEMTEYLITNQVDGSTRAKTLWKVKLGLITDPNEFIKNDLPAPYKDFGPAIRAAMEKAQHFHCREPHFINDEYYNGPVDAERGEMERTEDKKAESEPEIPWSEPTAGSDGKE